jgi:hypothetical protein
MTHPDALDAPGNPSARAVHHLTPEQRLSVGAAVAQRIADQSTSFSAVTQAAGIDPKTLRTFITGARWPTAGVRARIELALKWPPGEILRRASATSQYGSSLDAFTSTELLAELLHRSATYERTKRALLMSMPEVGSIISEHDPEPLSDDDPVGVAT